MRRKGPSSNERWRRRECESSWLERRQQGRRLNWRRNDKRNWLKGNEKVWHRQSYGQWVCVWQDSGGSSRIRGIGVLEGLIGFQTRNWDFEINDCALPRHVALTVTIEFKVFRAVFTTSD